MTAHLFCIEALLSPDFKGWFLVQPIVFGAVAAVLI